MTDTVPARRRYDSSRRREQAAETRERIVTAGADLLRGSSIRDWRAVTIRAVAERAGVNERTVYRHFANERGLRDAVLHRLEREAGIDLATLHLDDVGEVAGRIFSFASTYPLETRAPLDPTLTDTYRRQREALVGAVAERAGRWPDDDRVAAAAILDVLWGLSTYERLVADWQLDHDRAVGAVSWAIAVLTEAIRDGGPPGKV